MTLQSLLEDMGYETQSYSGRGMFGKECLGVCLNCENEETPYRLLGELAQELVEDAISKTEDGVEVDHSDILKAIKRTKNDSLGLDTIVYWPGTPYVA